MSLLRKLPSPPKGKFGWPWTKESPELPSIMPNGKPWPKISIVTPSFNQGLFIEETIRSVLLQNYPNLEYVIIDGGSTDNSVEIIKKYEPWLTYWVSEKDRGQSHAINKGLEHSTGDIMNWINSDDYLQMGALKTVALELPLDNENWLIGNAKITSSRGKKIYIKKITTDINIDNFMHWNQDWIPQQSTFWNRKLMRKSGLIDESLHYAMDLDILYRFYKITSPRLCCNVLSSYRIHEAAKTQDNNEKSVKETAIWIINNILNVSQKDNIHLIKYVEDNIRKNKIIHKLNHHIVFSRIIIFWHQHINKNIFRDILKNQ